MNINGFHRLRGKIRAQRANVSPETTTRLFLLCLGVMAVASPACSIGSLGARRMLKALGKRPL